MTQEEAKQFVYEMIDRVTLPFSETDNNVMKIAEGFAAVQFEQGYSQVVAVGIDDTGEIHTEIQLDHLSGRNNICAEEFLISKIRKLHRKLTLSVAWRHGIGVANPCPGCADGLFHFFPDTHVIVWAHELRRKVPIRAVVPIPFKRREPSKKTNGVVMLTGS